MPSLLPSILDARPLPTCATDTIGHSREGRPIQAFLFGQGPLRVSLIAGCHADEPVGPLLLRRLAAFLASLSPENLFLKAMEWWLIPHLNPDGEERNRGWWRGAEDACDLIGYLTQAVREPPGDDIEFGFPRNLDDLEARPENQAAWSWWRTARGPFHLHASLHGMAFAGGPWFLIDPAWTDRTRELRRRCAEAAQRLGYPLHDVERRGEKGFHRVERGFATRPSSQAMAQHFLSLGDEMTARLFRPSSMEAIRSLGGDPLTLVSEMPLFITPGVGEEIGPPDLKALEWKRKIDVWRLQLSRGQKPERIQACSDSGCLAPMPVRNQMALQWEFVCAGLEAVKSASPDTLAVDSTSL